jgi:membrane-associated phospholipid phosphatase
MIEQVDIAIVTFVNGFAGQSALFDKILLEILHMSTFKMLPLVALMVWLWFDEDVRLNERRKILFCSMIGGFFALVITRVVQNIGPHRLRPAVDGRFHFTLPEGAFVKDWSSFPSDTSALAFALAMGVWLASRRMGLLALLWATLVVSFPRLYGGYHYLSDLVAGAVIGAACTFGFTRFRLVSDRLFGKVSQLSSRHPAWFYAISFVIAFQTSTYFIDLRDAGSKVLRSVGIR